MRMQFLRLVLAGLIVAIVGCGTIDADMQLRFTSDSKVDSRVSLTGTGALGNMLAGGNNVFSNFDRTIWDVQRDVKDGNVVIVATTRASVPVAEQPMFRGENEQFKNTSWVVGGNPLVRTYRFSMDLTTKPIDPPQQNAFLDARAMNNLADAAFKMTIAVTMPGQITATNADNTSGSTAKWLINYSGMVAGKNLTVDSQEIMWANIGMSTLALLGIVGGGTWLRRRGRTTVVSAPQQDGSLAGERSADP